jgi:hypothetical protein
VLEFLRFRQSLMQANMHMDRKMPRTLDLYDARQMGGLWRNPLVVLALVCICFGQAHAQNGEAAPERCGIDSSGRSTCGGNSSGTAPGLGATVRRNCQSSCNSLYSQCLAVTGDDRLKEDCNRKQTFCIKSC